jgi:UDP-N-acetylglucosamine 2-epimerase
VDSALTSADINAYGVGHEIDTSRPFLTIIQHPVTTEHDNRAHLETTLRAVAAVGLPAVWFWPNPDAGTGEMSEALRHFREQHAEATAHMRFITNLPAELFVALLRHTSCLIGNSSAGIKECSYLGTPVVNIGGRQQGRLHAQNVVHVAYDAAGIERRALDQLRHGRYPASDVYYRADTSESIVRLLSEVELYTQKRFHESTGAPVIAT